MGVVPKQEVKLHDWGYVSARAQHKPAKLFSEPSLGASVGFRADYARNTNHGTL